MAKLGFFQRMPFDPLRDPPIAVNNTRTNHSEGVEDLRETLGKSVCVSFHDITLYQFIQAGLTLDITRI